MNLKTITDTEKNIYFNFSKLDFKQIVENFELHEKDECIFKQGWRYLLNQNIFFDTTYKWRLFW